MKKRIYDIRGLVYVLAAAVAINVLATTAALAGDVWSDEFDEWCNPDPGPGSSDKCPIGTTPNVTAFRAYYSVEVACGEQYELKQDHMEDAAGYSVEVEQNSGIPLVRHAHDMASEIAALPGNTLGRTAVNGSGEILDPLDESYVDPATIPTVLKGRHQFYTLGGSAANNVFYIELCAEVQGEVDRAPVNWNMMNCFTQYYGYPGPPVDPEEKGEWRSPILITTDGTVHASFALGMFALIDDYNCNLEAGHFCTEYKPVAFNGLNWVALDGLPNLANGWNKFEYYIGTNYIEIRLKAGAGAWTKTRIERQYTGPFNQIAMGTPQGVDQDPARCERVNWDGDKTCVGGINRGDTCTTNADCPPSIGTCVSDVCVGGTNDGGACTTDDDCPDYKECLWIPKGEEKVVNKVWAEELFLQDGIFETPLQSIGACCLGNGTCVENKNPIECNALDGVFTADGVTCAETNCDGACCLAQGACQDVSRDGCQTAGGAFQGINTECATSDCPFCTEPSFDWDWDGDVDQMDFGVFQRCLGRSTSWMSGCECFDSDGDTQVDGDDFLDFADCFSGPQVPANPNCAD